MRHVTVLVGFGRLVLWHCIELISTNNAASDRQQRPFTNEVAVDLSGTLSPFVDAPHDERLSSSAITRSEDTWNIGVLLSLGSLNVLSWIKLNLAFEQSIIWAQETHR